MTHLFRPAEPHDAAPLPQWTGVAHRLYVVARQLLARAGGLFLSPWARAMSVRVLLWLALVGQVVLALTTMYLIDLSISLMELWAELARKHLEITL